ncbi:hypothetical protein ACFOZ7_17635 [Natribaculum luteum]|uniref:HEAT repeat domain-containing protein n=1 Tax=Natribaculum luteum TaxID=1586232 RepID=A0ABD5P3F5_9EURY|nr:hypothetical protein [Natribaculum luteum]
MIDDDPTTDHQPSIDLRTLEQLRLDLQAGRRDPEDVLDRLSSHVGSGERYVGPRAVSVLLEAAHRRPALADDVVDAIDGFPFSMVHSLYAHSAFQIARLPVGTTLQFVDQLPPHLKLTDSGTWATMAIGRKTPAMFLSRFGSNVFPVDEHLGLVNRLLHAEPAVVRRAITDRLFAIDQSGGTATPPRTADLSTGEEDDESGLSELLSEGREPSPVHEAASDLGQIGLSNPDAIPSFEPHELFDPTDVESMSAEAIDAVADYFGVRLAGRDGRLDPVGLPAGERDATRDAASTVLEAYLTLQSREGCNWRSPLARSLVWGIHRIAHARPNVFADRLDALVVPGIADQFWPVKRVLGTIACCWRHCPESRLEGYVLPLSQLSADRHERRRLALVALASGGAAVVDWFGVEALIERLDDEDEDVRETAVRCLIDLGCCHPGCRPAIVAALSDAFAAADPEFAAVVADWLATAARFWPRQAPRAVSTLRQALSERLDRGEPAVDALCSLVDSYPDLAPEIGDDIVGALGADRVDDQEVYRWIASTARQQPAVVLDRADEMIDAAIDSASNGASEAAWAVFWIAVADPDSVEGRVDELESILADPGTDSVRSIPLAGAIAAVDPTSARASDALDLLTRLLSRSPEDACTVLAELAPATDRAAAPVVEYAIAASRARSHSDPLEERHREPDTAPDETVPDLGPAVADAAVAAGTAHPAYALPLALALEDWLRHPDTADRVRATRIASGLVTEWPHAGPILESALIGLLDHADPELVLAAIPGLAATDTPSTREALRELTGHPHQSIRAAASSALADPTDSHWMPEGAPVDPSPAVIDTAAAGLATDPSAAIDRVQTSAEAAPALRSRAICHLLLCLAASERSAEADRTIAAVRSLTAHADDDTRTESPADRSHQLDRLIGALLDHQAPLVRAQAASLAEAVGSDLGGASMAVRSGLVDGLSDPAPFVRARSADAVGAVAATLSVSESAATDALVKSADGLEGPAAMRAAAELTTVDPSSAERIVDALPPLASTDPIGRWYAARTMERAALASDDAGAMIAAPPLKFVTSPPEEGFPIAVLRAIEALPGSAIVDVEGGPEILVSIVNGTVPPADITVQSDRYRAGAADRLFAAARADPTAVGRAIGDLDTVADSAHDSDTTRALVFATEAVARERPGAITDFADDLIDLATGTDLYEPGKQAIARTIAWIGHDEFSEFVSSYKEGDPIAPLDPVPTAAYLCSTDCETRREVADLAADVLPDDLLVSVVDRLLASSTAGNERQRAIALDALVRVGAGLSAGANRDRVGSAILDALDGGWDLRSTAVSLLPTAGHHDLLSSAMAASAAIGCLSDERPTVRARAADALAELVETDAVDAMEVTSEVVDRSRRGDRSARCGVALALGKIAQIDVSVQSVAVDQFCDLVAADDDLPRRRAMEALADVAEVGRGRIRGRARAVFRDGLDDPDPETTTAAIRGLGHVGDRSDLQRLTRLSKPPSGAGRDALDAATARLRARIGRERAVLLSNALSLASTDPVDGDG